MFFNAFIFLFIIFIICLLHNFLISKYFYFLITGSIPSSFGNFCNLEFLDLSSNNLNGSLPEIINGTETCNSKSPLPNLRELYLEYNQLMGKLPNWLSEVKHLKELDISHNQLQG